MLANQSKGDREYLPGYLAKKPLSSTVLEPSSCICTAAYVKSDLVQKYDTAKKFVCAIFYKHCFWVLSIYSRTIQERSPNAVFIFKLFCKKSKMKEVIFEFVYTC